MAPGSLLDRQWHSAKVSHPHSKASASDDSQLHNPCQSSGASVAQIGGDEEEEAEEEEEEVVVEVEEDEEEIAEEIDLINDIDIGSSDSDNFLGFDPFNSILSSILYHYRNFQYYQLLVFIKLFKRH